MSALSRQVLAELKLAGVTRKQYVEYWFGPGAQWGGDRCGCHDDRCCGPDWHHDEYEPCGCFPVCLDEVSRSLRPPAP